MNRRILSAAVFTALLIFFSAPFGEISAQTEKTPADGESDFYSPRMLASDLARTDVVAYVDIKERKLVDFAGGTAEDCEQDRGAGYCMYELKGDLIETFKGKTTGREIVIYTAPDSDYQKKLLMGERVVFLNLVKNDGTGREELHTMENSTRRIEFDVLAKMRKIARKK